MAGVRRIVLGAGVALALGACAGTSGPPPGPVVAAKEALIADAVQQSLEHDRGGESRTWSSADGGQAGTVTPLRTAYLAAGRPCRDYRITITAAGRTQHAFGHACRAADGRWVDAPPTPFVNQPDPARAQLMAEQRFRAAQIDPFYHVGFPFDPVYRHHYAPRHYSGVGLQFSFGY